MQSSPLVYLAEAAHADTAAGGSVFDALGIDWQMLLFQIIGFVVLVVLMGRFVYPILLRSVDKRQEEIEASTKAAQAAEKKAASAQADIEKALQKARDEARDIVATAKAEATAMTETADAKAKARAERTTAEAQEEIAKSVLKARRDLEKDTLQLVKQAAATVTAHVADEKLDTALIKQAVKEAS